MKKFFIIMLMAIFVGTMPLASFAEVAPVKTSDEELPDTNGEVITVTAKGLVCEFCAKALEKVFLRREEVSGISVDLSTKEIVIRMNDGQTMDNETISKLILDSGYNIAAITRGGGDNHGAAE